MNQVADVLGVAFASSAALAAACTVALFAIPLEARPAVFPRLAVGASVVVVLVAVGATLSGVGRETALGVALALGCWVVVWARATSGWAVRGVLAWAMTSVAGLTYLTYVAWWMATTELRWFELAASLVLWVLEAFVFVLALGYVWELVDVLARRRWDRAPDLDAADPSYRPFVSLHVPAHNEPPEMVIETLRSLLALEYDDYEIVMIDDNTDDEALWRPVEAFCAAHPRITFVHLQDWPGYKSGALNYALTVTDPHAEVIGIVDADYQVAPDWLARVAPLFAQPDLAFVQTPQDYRDWQDSAYSRRLYHSYAYFFDVSQRSRNEANGAIFGGTMGLIRKEALTAVGGWDEWCITEDAELSLRLLKAGWQGQHVHESFGHGLMPLTFEALKRQRFRWCFGGIQILRMHGRSLLPWDRSPGNNLTLRQRWAYFVGGLQWYGDLAALCFAALLLMGGLSLLFGEGLVVRRMSGLLLLALVVLVGLGALRSLAMVRRTRSASWGQSLGAFGMWVGLTWAVAQGAFRGTFARQGEFLRTPKERPDLDWRDAVRGNRFEASVAMVCLVVSLALLADPSPVGLAIAALLAVQALAFGAAPANSVAAIRALSDADRRRLRVGLRSWTGPVAATRFVLWPSAAAAVLLMAVVTLASPADAPLAGRVLDGIDSPAEPAQDDPRPGPAVSSDLTDDPVPGTLPGADPVPPAPGLTPAPEPAPAPSAAASAPPPAVSPTAAPAPSVPATVAPPAPTPTTGQGQGGGTAPPGRPVTPPSPSARPTGRP